MGDELKYLLSEPIEIKDLGRLRQPTVADIIHEGGEDVLNEYLGVISFSKEHLEGDGVDLKDLSNFEVVCLIEDKGFRQTFIKAVEFFTGEKVHFLDEVMIISVGKTGKLHNENFDEFVGAVLKMHLRERSEPENKRTEKMTEKQKKIYEKLQMHRRRHQEKNRFHLIDVINIVKHGGPSFVSKEEIRNMTYFELYKAFEVIVSKDNYGEFLRYKTSPNFKVEDSVQHWTLSIKHNK